jgi:SAM-dependent methyltransferase
MPMREGFASEDAPAVARLRQRLDAFYAAPGEYDAFAEPNWKPEYWSHIRQAALARIADKGRCRILEIGAGRTSFGRYLAELRPQVEFHAQDVTAANRAYLEAQADAVHIADATEVGGTYDIVFSTFAWEHISSPRRTMLHLLGRLEPGGCVFVASPRYDFPGYLSPSARHLPRTQRVAIAAWLAWRRLRVILGARADFLVHIDPAVLRGRWFRDADAVHWVSLWDLERELGDGHEIRRIRIPATGLRGWFWEKYLLLFVSITPKTGGASR